MINIKKVGLYFSAAVISCAALSSIAANQNQSQQDAYAAACASYLGNVDPGSYSATPIAPYQTIQACVANASCNNSQLANITDCTTKLATLAAMSINNTAQQVAGSASGGTSGGGGMQSTYQSSTQNTAPTENSAPNNNTSDTNQNSSKTTDSGKDKGVNWF